MRRLVVLFGLVIVAMGIVGIVRPERSFGVMLDLPASVLLYVAVAVRVLFGMVFILAAPNCRFPRIMYVVGIASFVAAFVTMWLGADRLQSVVHWWFRQAPLFLQSVYAVVVLFGAFLVYAGCGHPGNEHRSHPSLRLPDD